MKGWYILKSNNFPILRFLQIRRLSSRSTWRIGIHSKYARTAFILRESTLIRPAFRNDASVLFMPDEPSLYPLLLIS
jgi:hypothetical protein